MEGDHLAAAEHNERLPQFAASDLPDTSPLDSKFINKAAFTKAVARLPPGETDWSREGFPWWVFMAGRMHLFGPTIDQGIIRVTAVANCVFWPQPSYMRATTDRKNTMF